MSHPGLAMAFCTTWLTKTFKKREIIVGVQFVCNLEQVLKMYDLPPEKEKSPWQVFIF